jgi:hypothetical protein
MTDRELLELAAKAHGGFVHVPDMGWIAEDEHGNRGGWWNPLGDDGDALRLAVKLGLMVDCLSRSAMPLKQDIGWTQGGMADSYAATRRAIVRAAACIGESMK